MKNFIVKKYDLHLLRGFAVACLIYSLSVPAGMREILAVFVAACLSFLWNGLKWYFLKVSTDIVDVLADVAGAIIAVTIWTFAADLDLKNFIGWYVLVLSITLWVCRFPSFRNFWIKHFVLNYLKPFTYLRAAAITFPLVVLNGVWVAVDDFNPYLFFPLLIAFYFGFVYFKGLPVKFSELDKSQKFQFGFFPGVQLTAAEYREWELIVDEFNNKK
jgi:hypothetical protein